MPAPGTFKKTGLPNLPKDPVVKPPRTQVWTMVRMPGKTLTSKLIKPVGAALLLLVSAAQADTSVITAPQGNAPANVPATCAALAAVGVLSVKCPPYGALGKGTANDTVAIYAALSAATAGQTVRVPAGTYLLNPAAQPAGANRVLKSNVTLACDQGTTFKLAPG